MIHFKKKTIVLASLNLGKVKEIRQLLSDLPIELIPQSNFQASQIPETGDTFFENALIKARHANKKARLPALADDSGLCIDALDGAPGIYSARYAGKNSTDQDRIIKVLKAMEKIPEEERTAQFHCVLVLVRSEKDKAPLVCHGTWKGRILNEPRGTLGFGYDPIFYLPKYHCSAAELEPTFKNRISHRGLAIQQLQKKLLESMNSSFEIIN